MVKTWDILTGLCKASFKTPADGAYHRDIRLIDGRLILVWLRDNNAHVWDAEKGELLQILDASGWGVIRISGDGSIFFVWIPNSFKHGLCGHGESMSKVEVVEWESLDPLQVDGLRIWVQLGD